MMITDNDYDSLNDVCREVADITKIITRVDNAEIFTLLTSWTAERYLQVIFAQEEKYGALITGQCWSSGP